MKSFLSLFLLLFAATSFSQTVDKDFYEKIRNAALPHVERIENGNIEALKNVTPPKDTWRFQDLLEYKKVLEEDTTLIFHGYYIEPSLTQDGIYAYNGFAYRQVDDKYEYFYTAIISVDTKNAFKVTTTYLFTIDSSIQSWWRHTFGMYRNGHLDTIPKTHSYWAICPPPHK